MSRFGALILLQKCTHQNVQVKFNPLAYYFEQARACFCWNCARICKSSHPPSFYTTCCIFPPALFGLIFCHFCNKILQKMCQKHRKKDVDQHLKCTAPKCWSKYAPPSSVVEKYTLLFLFPSLFLSCIFIFHCFHFTLTVLSSTLLALC